MNEDEWGDLECLYEVCLAAVTVWGVFTDTGVNVPRWVWMTEWKVRENRQSLCKQTKEERIRQQATGEHHSALIKYDLFDALNENYQAAFSL